MVEYLSVWCGNYVDESIEEPAKRVKLEDCITDRIERNNLNGTDAESYLYQGKHGNQLFLISMENEQLESLREYMDENNRFSEDELRDIASCCLLGLDFLHSRHIIHGVVEH